EIATEYAADQAAFDKKWKVSGRFYYVTGTLKRIDKNQIGKSGHAYRFVLAAGSTELHCWLDNETTVDADPPAAGDKVTLLLECRGYENEVKGIAMNGVYVGK